GEGGLGGLGGSDGTDSSAELADACEARCATTVSLECPENTDQDECEADCTNGAVIGCEDEWLALKRCESMLSSSGFQCLSFLGFNFVDLSLSGHTACVEEFRSEERRVGKECRCARRAAAYDIKETKAGVSYDS